MFELIAIILLVCVVLMCIAHFRFGKINDRFYLKVDTVLLFSFTFQLLSAVSKGYIILSVFQFIALIGVALLVRDAIDRGI